VISSSSTVDDDEAAEADAEVDVEVEVKVEGGGLSVPVMMELSSLRSESCERDGECEPSSGECEGGMMGWRL
jgi:hypothetical protein